MSGDRVILPRLAVTGRTNRVGSCSYKLKHLKIENPAANVHNKMVIDGEYYNITYEV